MRWSAPWAIDVPGQTAHAIGFDTRTDSVLVADGWGVAFASLSVRRIDAATGDIRAQVRTGRSIRAFGIGPEDTLLLLGDKSIAIHDASTLERRAVHDIRVPRYSNAIAPLPDGSVALMAPSGLVAFELATGRSRKLSKVPAVALGTFEKKAVAVLEDGSVVVAGGDLIGTFESPCFTDASMHRRAPSRRLAAFASTGSDRRHFTSRLCAHAGCRRQSSFQWLRQRSV
jgi:hypothetical protein